MENNNNEQGIFTYTYSAEEQAEIRRIRERYTPKADTEDKMARLRRLDAAATRTAQLVALTLGIIGTLILGFGMSLCMTDIGNILGAYKDMALLVGIIIGVLGGVLVGLAYPIYGAIVKIKRERLAPEIIRLTDELMK